MAEKETVGVEVDVQVDGAKTIKDLKKDLKDATGEAVALSRQFGENSKEAQAAAKRVAALKDEIADVNERVQLFDPGQKFLAFGNAINTVTAGFTAAQGAMALFGTESEDLQKQLVKLQGALALSQGLSQVFDAGKSFKDLGAIIRDKVVGAFTTLKGAIAATGFGLLVVALGTIVTNFDKIEAWLKKLIPGFEGFGAVFNKVKAIAMGTFNAIVEGFRVVWDVVSNIWTADFSAAADAAFNAGSRIGKAYAAGFEQEVKDQAEQAARERVNAQIEYMERELKVMRASGERRVAEANEYERKLLQVKLKNQDLFSKEYYSAEADLRAFDAAAAEDRRKQAEENAKKAQEERQKAGQKALSELTTQQELEYRRAVISGNDVFLLKQQQLAAQLALYKKYGLDLDLIQKQQVQEELDRRERLNKELKTNLEIRLQDDITALINQENARIAFQQRNQIIENTSTELVAAGEEEKRFQFEATNRLLNGLIEEREQLSELEKGAAIATMLATVFAEEGKMSALERTSIVLRGSAKILGEQTAIGKAAAIASTAIDTYKAAQLSFTAFAGIPIVGPALGAVAAAAAIVAGIARVKTITSIKVPGAAGSGAPSLPAMPSAPTMPRINPNDTQGIMIDQLQQTNSNMRQPQRIYVLESDITSTQERVADIEENAKF